MAKWPSGQKTGQLEGRNIGLLGRRFGDELGDELGGQLEDCTRGSKGAPKYRRASGARQLGQSGGLGLSRLLGGGDCVQNGRPDLRVAGSWRKRAQFVGAQATLLQTGLLEPAWKPPECCKRPAPLVATHAIKLHSLTRRSSAPLAPRPMD